MRRAGRFGLLPRGGEKAFDQVVHGLQPFVKIGAQVFDIHVHHGGQPVEIGGELFSDAMGDPATAGGNYIGMIHANTAAIATALGGTPAPLPPALADWAAQWSIQ